MDDGLIIPFEAAAFQRASFSGLVSVFSVLPLNPLCSLSHSAPALWHDSQEIPATGC